MTETAEKTQKRAPEVKYLPKGALALLDEAILKGYGASGCLKFLVGNYSGNALPQLPTPGTMYHYIKRRKKFFTEHTDARLRLEMEMNDGLSLRHINPDNPTQVLQAMIAVLADRVDEIKVINSHNRDARFERVIVDGTLAIKEFLKTKMEMEDREFVRAEKLKMTASIIARHIMEVVAETYKKLHGQTKFEDFAKSARTGLTAIDFNALTVEIGGALKSLEPAKEGR